MGSLLLKARASNSGTLGATSVRVKVGQRLLARGNETEILRLPRAAEQPAHRRARSQAEAGHDILAAQ
jgi:hypothetical protein